MERQKMKFLYQKAWDAALDVDFITEQWEFDLYVKSLYSAMLWGKGFKGEEPI